MFKSSMSLRVGRKTEVYVTLMCDVCRNDFEKIVIQSRARQLELNERHFCSNSCYSKSRKRGGLSYLKSQETCIEKFGVPHHMKSEDFKQNFGDKIEEKYGVRNTSQTAAVRQKLSEANRKPEIVEAKRRRWVEDGNPAKQPEVKKKLVEALKRWSQQKHCVDNPSQVKEIYEKGRQTCIEKYGDEHPIRVLENKRRETCLQTYGSTNPLNSKLVMDKIMLRKWGMTWEERNASLPAYLKYAREVLKITRSQDLETIPNYSLRGKDYHLDHKFSVSEGFRQGIPPEVIGDIINLQMLPSRENIQKSSDCSITKQELLTEYEKRKSQ